MNILLVAQKLDNTYLKIYTKEEGFFSKNEKYYAELYSEGQLQRKYKVESKYIAQFVSTYKGLFDIANRPWPNFSESETERLLEFINSGFLCEMIERFDCGMMLKYHEDTNLISVVTGLNEFNLHLYGESGIYTYKADKSWARIDPDYYDYYNCNCQLNRSQIELFLATIGYQFNQGLMPGIIRDISSYHISSNRIIAGSLLFPTRWVRGIARSILYQRFYF